MPLKCLTARAEKSRSLAGRVQQLGQLRAHLAQLQTAERQLTAEVRSAMEAAQLTAIESADYCAQLAEQRRLRLDPRAVFRRLGERLFWSVASVSASAVRQADPMADLEGLGEYETSVQLRVCRRPGKGEK
jgi:hypothetical protein